jgi:2,4-dienoyl-CoA reductase-like NADH-dependent reductase (Old Yellow Enzyme family)/thioredoxin reductase
MSYERILSPIKIGNQIIKNRIALAPMGTSLQGPSGTVTTEMVDYFEARARGGTGMIISPFTSVDDRYRVITIGLHTPLLTAGIARLAEAVKFYGSKFILQISHFGGRIPGFLSGRQAVAPSAIESPTFPEMPKELTLNEIREIVQMFITTATLAKTAGCDGVELHGAHGYLINQFVSPFTNRREDNYGGDFKKRMNFLVEIIEGIRKSCGNDFIIGYKFSAYEHLKGGVDIDLAIEIGKYIAEKGIDYLHVSALSTTIPGQIDTEFPSVPTIYHSSQGSLIPLAEKIKQNVMTIPVLGTGGISDPDIAEGFLKDVKADMLVLGRALIAEPDWVNKLKNGGIIRQCIKCQSCYKRVLNLSWVKCTLNPVTCDEGRYEKYLYEKALISKKVVIIGAGPAGLEAAFRASQRGHKVILFDSQKQIGGNLKIAAVPQFKYELKKLLESYMLEITTSNVDLRLGIKINSYEDIQKENPDAVIIAIGADPIIPEIEGIHNENVLTSIEYYSGSKKISGNNVLVIGCGDVGSELAFDLALKKNDVTAVEVVTEEEMLADENKAYRTGVYSKIKKLGVKIINESHVRIIEKARVIIEDNKSGKEFISYPDSIVLASGFTCKSNQVESLKKAFNNKVKEIYAIGDCTTVGRLYEAIHSGAETAWQL